jgi:hypothetical protein
MSTDNSIQQNNIDVNPQIELKTRRELNIWAFKNNKAKELSTSYKLHYLNLEGNGDIPLNKVIDGLISFFGYSKSTIYRILRKENPFYCLTFNKHEQIWYVHLVGIKKLAVLFNFDHLTTPLIVTITKDTTYRQLKSLLYSTFFKTADYNKPVINPISHLAVKEATTVDIRTQQFYNRLSSVQIIPNYTDRIKEYPGKNKIFMTAEQLPNTYYTLLKCGNKGNTRKINNFLNAFHKLTPSLVTAAAKGSQHARRYFENVKSYFSCKNKTASQFIFYNDNNGYGLWRSC